MSHKYCWLCTVGEQTVGTGGCRFFRAMQVSCVNMAKGMAQQTGNFALLDLYVAVRNILKCLCTSNQPTSNVDRNDIIQHNKFHIKKSIK